MEERINNQAHLDVENIRHNYHAISIRQSPPLTYDTIRQHSNGIDRCLESVLNDPAPNRQPSSSAALITSKVPMGARSRPLPVPVQPKVSATVTELQPAVSSGPAISSNTQRPPLVLHNHRRRPLPQPGVFSTANSTSSSHSSSLLSCSYQSGYSSSNEFSLCTSSSHLPQSSPPSQLTFASTSRATTLPTLMQTSRDHVTQETLVPRRADTQPISAPPTSAGFMIETAMPPRGENAAQTEAAEIGKAKHNTGAENQPETESTDGSEMRRTLLATAGQTSKSVSAAGATLQIPSLPEIDLGGRISPMSFFAEQKQGPKNKVTNAAQNTTGNQLGLVGVNKDSRPSKASVPTASHLPPAPAVQPPLPPPLRERASASQVAPSGTVALRPIVAHPNVSTTKKNRPVLAIRTWDLDKRSTTKKEQRKTAPGAPPLPTKPSASLQLPSNQSTSRHSASRSKKEHGTSFLPSVRTTARREEIQAAVFAPQIPVSSTSALPHPPLLGPGIPAHLQPPQPTSNGGGLATQLRKMKILHRKSKSGGGTDWNGSAYSSNPTEFSSRARAGSPPPSLPSASVVQNKSLFGQRHPYGYQRGVAATSLISVGASMRTTSGSSMVNSAAPRPDTLYSTIAPVFSPPPQQPASFQLTPQPPTLPPAESKKSIGMLWTKLKFGSSRKTTAPTTAGKGSGLVELW